MSEVNLGVRFPTYFHPLRLPLNRAELDAIAERIVSCFRNMEADGELQRPIGERHDEE